MKKEYEVINLLNVPNWFMDEMTTVIRHSKPYNSFDATSKENCGSPRD